MQSSFKFHITLFKEMPVFKGVLAITSNYFLNKLQLSQVCCPSLVSCHCYNLNNSLILYLLPGPGPGLCHSGAGPGDNGNLSRDSNHTILNPKELSLRTQQIILISPIPTSPASQKLIWAWVPEEINPPNEWKCEIQEQKKTNSMPTIIFLDMITLLMIFLFLRGIILDSGIYFNLGVENSLDSSRERGDYDHFGCQFSRKSANFGTLPTTHSPTVYREFTKINNLLQVWVKVKIKSDAPFLHQFCWLRGYLMCWFQKWCPFVAATT